MTTPVQVRAIPEGIKEKPWVIVKPLNQEEINTGKIKLFKKDVDRHILNHFSKLNPEHVFNKDGLSVKLFDHTNGNAMNATQGPTHTVKLKGSKDAPMVDVEMKSVMGNRSLRTGEKADWIGLFWDTRFNRLGIKFDRGSN